jgi:hypothetical protein
VADWNAIRQEYITDESSSYRKLAQKYGVSLTAIYNRGRDEKWVELRQQTKDKTIAKAVDKISDEQSEIQADVALRFNDMTVSLAGKLEKAIAEVDPKDTTGIRRLAASLCDLKLLIGVKSDADSREQEARIANLRRQAEKDDIDNAPTLVVEGLPEEFKV